MNTNEIQIFKNALFGSVRILEQNDGKILFCGKDVASALGYAIPSKEKSGCYIRNTLKRVIPARKRRPSLATMDSSIPVYIPIGRRRDDFSSMTC